MKNWFTDSIDGRTLSPASINRTLGLLRHMLNWAVGREYLDRTPFRRGTEVLVRLEREDNKRRRRLSEEEQTALLAVASPHLRLDDLAADCQQRLREINLHWHDLRHEYASRLVERGVPPAQVRDLLGHASIVTTERYDNQRLDALQAAVARLEDGKAFDAVSDVTGKPSRIFQVPAEQGVAERSDLSKEIFRSN